MFYHVDLPQHEPNSGNNRGEEKKRLAEGKTMFKKSQVTGVRLGYNLLTTLEGLGEVLSTVMNDPYKNLTFLDLSHNRLSKLEPELCKFENLAVIYLHGNTLPDLRSVAVLNECKNLKKVTLHGNPSYVPSSPEDAASPGRNQPTLEADPWYRVGITWMLRDTMLHSIDFIAITPKVSNPEEKGINWTEREKIAGVSSL